VRYGDVLESALEEITQHRIFTISNSQEHSCSTQVFDDFCRRLRKHAYEAGEVYDGEAGTNLVQMKHSA